MHIVGTAGHVDHGKSSLVRALTGVDPDRWREEQLRGMTLDLGFARLRFDDGVEAGIVDVPGHERFVHNMLAGAAGMECVLLVVAANEGPRPQTLEHLAILSYLNVKRAIVVLTKSDLVDSEDLALARELALDAVRGSVAAGAPIVAVSTLTGAGLRELREAIHAALIALPARAPDAPPFLPVDRVFALPGLGTILTGTLMQGTIDVGATLRLYPSGRDVFVRSLQVFGERRDRVEGGTRVAANVRGVDVTDIVRGDVLAGPEFATAQRLAVQFKPLERALPMLRRRNSVRAYLGSAELLGTLVFPTAPTSDASISGELVLRRPVATYPGEAFVIRRQSPKDVLGGGTVGSAQLAPARDLTPDEDAVATVLRVMGTAPAVASTIAARANVREERAIAVLDALVERGIARRLAKPIAYVDGAEADAVFARASVLVGAIHQEAPWTMGLTSLALAKALGIAEPLVMRILATYLDEGLLQYRHGYYARSGFVPELTVEQRSLFERLVPFDPSAPLLPAPLDAVATTLKARTAVGVAQAFETLLATGALVKVHDAVYRGTQIADARARVESALRREGSLTMAQFRDTLGTSRKYAVPLMEYFDAIGVTLRSGDVRLLRNS